MRVGVLGINHKSADLNLREQLARACQKRFSPDYALFPAFSYVVLSTCNRTEIYFSSDDLPLAHTALLAVLRSEIKEEFEHRIYSYFASDCFFHLARVTAGIDSAILGETEIQGQVKQAYEVAALTQPLTKDLHFIFQKSLKIGKEVRSKAFLTRGLPELDDAILQAIKNTFTEIYDKKVLFVGISEINHKIFERFKKEGFKNITFCNRTKEKLMVLEAREKISILDWQDQEKWNFYDILVFGTKSTQFLLDHALPGTISHKLVLDLSVPRNVDPKVGKFPNISLLNIDQLNKTIERKRRQKKMFVAEVENRVISKAVASQIDIFRLKEIKGLQRLLCVS